jgi:hypothetical protein
MCSICAGGTCWCGSVGRDRSAPVAHPRGRACPKIGRTTARAPSDEIGDLTRAGGPADPADRSHTMCGIGDHRARRSARPWSSARQQSTRPPARGSKRVLSGALPVRAGCLNTSKAARGHARSPLGNPRSPQPRRRARRPPYRKNNTPHDPHIPAPPRAARRRSNGPSVQTDGTNDPVIRGPTLAPRGALPRRNDRHIRPDLPHKRTAHPGAPSLAPPVQLPPRNERHTRPDLSDERATRPAAPAPPLHPGLPMQLRG